MNRRNFNVRRPEGSGENDKDKETPAKWRERVERKLESLERGYKAVEKGYEKHAVYWQLAIAIGGLVLSGVLPKLLGWN